jgi:hypothetical protein
MANSYGYESKLYSADAAAVKSYRVAVSLKKRVAVVIGLKI